MARVLIVEADGGSRGNPGLSGSGAIVVDAASGELLAEIGLYGGIASNNVAEYKGMIAGVRRALELDPNAELHIRMDSKLVVEQMMGRWKIKHPVDGRPRRRGARAAHRHPGEVRVDPAARELPRRQAREQGDGPEAGLSH